MAVVQGQATLADAPAIQQQYPGYASWNDQQSLVNDFNATGGAGKGGPAASGAPTPNANTAPQGGTTTSMPATGGGAAPAAPTGNPSSFNTSQDAVAAGYGGYAGWGDAEMKADIAAGNAQGKFTGAAAGSGSVFGNQPSINIPGLYETYSQQAGIPDLQSSITAKETGYNTAVSQINDNPYLSEANRVGRIQKLTTDYNNDVKTTQDALTMAQADVNMKIQLQTQQFNIDSQQAQLALSEFNSLLSSGALDGASGQDIANITAATGISSSEVQAAINSQVQKDTPTQILTRSYNGNDYAVVLNQKTGTVISQSLIGPTQTTPQVQTIQEQSGGQNLAVTLTNGVVTSTADLGPVEPPAPSGGGSGGTTATQQRGFNSAAANALANVDANGVPGAGGGNPDKYLTQAEYQKAIQDTQAATGLSLSDAGQIVQDEANTLGYQVYG